jgi:hypothetical protein
MNQKNCIWAKARFPRISFNHDLKVVANHLNSSDNSIAPPFRAGNITNDKIRALAQCLIIKCN